MTKKRTNKRMLCPVISLRLPRHMAARIAAAAKNTGMTKTTIMLNALHVGLNTNTQQPEQQQQPKTPTAAQQQPNREQVIIMR